VHSTRGLEKSFSKQLHKCKSFRGEDQIVLCELKHTLLEYLMVSVNLAIGKTSLC